MKNLILIFSMVVLCAAASYAQCDKKVKFTSSKTEHLDSGGNLTRTENEDALVQISKSAVIVTVNGEPRGTFAVKSMTCDWKVPFKEGKMVIKGAMTTDQGDGLTVSLTFEGKDGKVTGYFVAEGQEEDVIKVVANKFEEDI